MSGELSDASALLRLFVRSPWQEFRVGTGGFRFHVRRGEPLPRIAMHAPHLATFRLAAKVGSMIRAGETVGRLEILGESSPLVAERDGAIAVCHVDDGALVEYGAPLVTLEIR